MSNKTKKGELSPRTQAFIEHHGSVVFIWVLLVIVPLLQKWPKLRRGELPGNDDYMRMAEIRDWLSGQSWFDLHQYRLNPVEPLISHWSRLSDILIGVPIKLLSPLVGQERAELFIVLAFPALSLLAFLYLGVKIVRKLTDSREASLITAAIIALSYTTLSQFSPGRIDHHGLQIIMAMATLYCLITSEAYPRRMIIAGILCGLGLYVGIESAPYVAAAIIAVVLVWVFDEEKSTRKLRMFGLSLAASTLVFLLISKPPSAWLTPTCDALSIVYTQLTLSIAIVLWILSRAGYTITSKTGRFILAGVLGGLALAVTLLLYPQCLKGPYAGLDPRLVEIWLSNVTEAGSWIKTFKAKPITASATLVMPLLAIAGYFFIAWPRKQALGIKMRTLFIFTVVTFLVGFLQIRGMLIASAVSAPLAAILLIETRKKVSRLRPKALGFIASLVALLALSPISLPLLVGALTGTNEISANKDEKSSKLKCTSAPVLKSLNSLPKGTALTQIDLGAPLLKFTGLSATSAPYHRNTSGILAAIDMFAGNEDTAYKAVQDMQADYVIFCVKSGETDLMKKYGTPGMMQDLLDNKVPNWMEPITTEYKDYIRVFKVKRTKTP